jgi:hypothetical protein
MVTRKRNAIIILLIFICSPYFARAESWEVTSEQNNADTSYYAGAGYGYYRRMPDKEIYYAPNIYVYSANNQYYYKLANLKPGEKFYPPSQEDIEKTYIGNTKRDGLKYGVKYTVGLVYYPKGMAREYLYHPVKKDEHQETINKDLKKIYPLYFD